MVSGGTADFVREYTLAGGGLNCDCGYKKEVGDHARIVPKVRQQSSNFK